MATKSKESTKPYLRLLRDVKQIMKKPLTNHGIYYVHDESDMYKGMAMIIGPKDTPYCDGFYFFKFQFPKNYPFSPPALKYYTNNGKTRFNPNLYRNGKVCLSVVNTWRGEQWTSCQTISSILMALVTIFTENPLTNEPGYASGHKDCLPYKRSVEFMNYYTAIYNMATRESLPDAFLGFYPIIKRHLLERKSDILKRLDTLANSPINNVTYRVGVYGMTTALEYTVLRDRMKKALSNI